MSFDWSKQWFSVTMYTSGQKYGRSKIFIKEASFQGSHKAAFI